MVRRERCRVSAPVSDEIATTFVVLKGGLAVPLEALQLAWALEGRGATFAVDGDDLVVEGARGLLTEADRAAIRRLRGHLKAIASYCGPEVIE
jgi:hypothetical protein